MALVLLLIFIGVPILEIAVFIKAGGLIGLWPTLAIVVLTAIAGSALLRYQGLATLAKARQSLAEDRLPLAELFDGLCLFLAGVLLLTPGFVTDAVGFLLFLPPVRLALRLWLMKRLMDSDGIWINGRRVDPRGDGGPHRNGGQSTGPTIIEGEFEEVEEGRDDTQDPSEGSGPGSQGSRWGRRR